MLNNIKFGGGVYIFDGGDGLPLPLPYVNVVQSILCDAIIYVAIARYFN